jgi:hypothetical protein
LLLRPSWVLAKASKPGISFLLFWSTPYGTRYDQSRKFRKTNSEKQKQKEQNTPAKRSEKYAATVDTVTWSWSRIRTSLVIRIVSCFPRFLGLFIESIQKDRNVFYLSFVLFSSFPR